MNETSQTNPTDSFQLSSCFFFPIIEIAFYLVGHEHLEGVDSDAFVRADVEHFLSDILVPVGHRHVQATASYKDFRTILWYKEF